MIPALLSALKARSVSAALLVAGLGVASVPRDPVDPEAVFAEAARPLPLPRGARYEFRFPAPGEYPLRYLPWIESREDFVAFHTRGEDPEEVRRYLRGPEEELIGFLAEVYRRRGEPVLTASELARLELAATGDR